MKRFFYALVAIAVVALAILMQTPAPAQDHSNCDSAYPDTCIAVYPPDLNCGDISQRRFRAYLPTDSDLSEGLTRFDPHGFDGDDDGIGCES
ncbi:MAG: hypothetical protein WBA10_01290 [Elainellaceae cyanobacterium]